MPMRELLKRAIQSKNFKALQLAKQLATPLNLFEPRLDDDAQLDQQTKFFNATHNGIICCLAGTGAGKSYVGAAKVAKYLKDTPPPEKNTPFWILSETMPMVTESLWQQNLANFITPDQIEGVSWYSELAQLPKKVILKPHANGNNYVIELKSYDQGRSALQARSIRGWWCDEQVRDMSIITELIGRTRKWSAPLQLYTLTPVEPDLTLEKLFEEKNPLYLFLRMNTRCNKTLDPEFIKNIEKAETPELIETRLTGAFAVYEGLIYNSFGKEHVIEPFEINKNWMRIRGFDTGHVHSTACLWAAIDLQGRYYIYREYNKNKTSVEEHIKEINDDWQEVLVKGNTYADPANAAILNEFRIRNFNYTNAIKDVEAGHASVRTLMAKGTDDRPMLQIFNTCQQLISQIRFYTYDKKRYGEPVRESEQRPQDLTDCLRYLCHSQKVLTTQRLEPIKKIEKKNRCPY